MSIDEQPVAPPQLYGAPAYSRPRPSGVAAVERPFDPDELPIEAQQTEEDREFSASLPARAFAPGGIPLGTQAPADGESRRSRTRSLREIAGRLLGGS